MGPNYLKEFKNKNSKSSIYSSLYIFEEWKKVEEGITGNYFKDFKTANYLNSREKYSFVGKEEINPGKNLRIETEEWVKETHLYRRGINKRKDVVGWKISNEKRVRWWEFIC